MYYYNDIIGKSGLFMFDFNNMTMVVPCMFGLESLVKDELLRMDIEVTEVRDGRVFFKGGIKEMCRANLRLRTGERVLILLSMFHATSFEDLYQGVKKIEWTAILDKFAAFPVESGHSIKSQLASIPDCQRIIKKAVVDKLNTTYKMERLPETGTLYPISFLIMNNEVQILLDTTGEGLYKRGYRANGSEAPLKETLAAAMVLLTRWRGRDLFIDPMCGSGTIAIEAAMIAADIAPGLKRSFAFEKYAFSSKEALQNERKACLEMIRKNDYRIEASDINPAMCELAAKNARLAGVEKYVNVTCKDVSKVDFDDEYATVICNPPYGERLMSMEDAQALYRKMGKTFIPHSKWKCYIITANEDFEKFYGKRADKKRKLYNGMIKCDFYQFFK